MTGRALSLVRKRYIVSESIDRLAYRKVFVPAGLRVSDYLDKEPKHDKRYSGSNYPC